MQKQTIVTPVEEKIITDSHLEIVSKVLYKGYITVETTDCLEYYLIPPPHCLAIPVSPLAHDSYRLVVARLKDWNLPETVSELPVCNVKVLRSCLSDYTILPVLKEKLICKPVEVISPMRLEAIQDAKRRQSYISKKKSYITGDINLEL